MQKLKPESGFTLIELMVVVAIVAILAAIAIPSFTEQMRKSRRSEAFQALGALQLQQERYRANNPRYGSLLELTGAATHVLPSGYYAVTVGVPAGSCASGVVAAQANSFVLTATAQGAQADDTRCATIVLTSLCGTTTKTSTPAGNTCWQ
jgi:type IV pilus assembly protein PilE